MPDNQTTPENAPVPPEEASLPYHLADDDKATPVMVYTMNGMSRGELVSKELVRVSTWLRTVTGITYVTLYRAQSVTTLGNATPLVISYSELHIPINQVIAYHLLPPAQEPLDYDPNEPNRKMEPLILNFGLFRAVGKLRISGNTSLSIHLRTLRESFVSVYDVEINNSSLPKMASIKAPLMLVQPSLATFAVKA